MRIVIALLSALTLNADDLKLTPEERQSEIEWLTSLGLKLPAGGILLDQPFATPLTNRSFLVPTSWWRAPAPREIIAADLRQDLPILRTIMQKAYGGWTSAEQRGWDWNRWFTDWDHDLAARGDTKLPLADALAPVAKLMDFQLDNHSGPVGGARFGSGSTTAILDAAPVGACTTMKAADDRTFALDPKDPAQAPKRATLYNVASEQPGYYLSYPNRRGLATAIQCGDKWIAARPVGNANRTQLIADLAQKPANEPSYRAVSETIGYLRLPTFSKQNGERLRALLPTLPKSAGHEKLLIVDLRSNDGGDAPIEALGRWLDGSSVRRAARFNRRQPKSCVYEALRWGYSQVTIQGLKPPLSDQLRGNLQHAMGALFAHSPAGCPVKIEEDKSAWDYRQHRFPSSPSAGKPRLLVLIDRGCGSDCEYMAYVLAASPGSIIAGENTFGVGQFIQPGYFILPHSRIKFRIALGMSDNYGDGRSFDGYGLDVDVLLTEEAHTAAAILKLAETWATRP